MLYTGGGGGDERFTSPQTSHQAFIEPRVLSTNLDTRPRPCGCRRRTVKSGAQPSDNAMLVPSSYVAKAALVSLHHSRVSQDHLNSDETLYATSSPITPDTLDSTTGEAELVRTALHALAH